jgi:hypothetical protein
LGATRYTAIEDVFLDLMAVEAELESAETPENVVSEASSDAPIAAGQLDGKGLQFMPGRKKSL